MLLDHNVRSRVETTREEHDDDQAVTPKTPNPDENQRGDRFLQNVCSEDPRRIHRNSVFHQKIIETAGGALVILVRENLVNILPDSGKTSPAEVDERFLLKRDSAVLPRFHPAPASERQSRR